MGGVIKFFYCLFVDYMCRTHVEVHTVAFQGIWWLV